MNPRLERAMRDASIWHLGQVRKVSQLPYAQHLFAVAWILDRAGFDEDVVVAGLLHDSLEDTTTTRETIASRYGERVATWVQACTEVKYDQSGNQRPWIDRKREHVELLRDAAIEARAIMLADKLHNLTAIEVDLELGEAVWSRFRAGRDEVIWYYQAVVECCGSGDPRLEFLAAECRAALERVVQQG